MDTHTQSAYHVVSLPAVIGSGRQYLPTINGSLYALKIHQAQASHKNAAVATFICGRRATIEIQFTRMLSILFGPANT